MAKKFIIFPTDEIYLIDFDKVKETSASTLTINNSNSKAIVEIDTSINNDFLKNITIIEQLDDVTQMLQSPEWFKGL